MKENVGGKDKIARIGGSIILVIASYLRLTGTAQLLLIIFGLYGIATGLIGYCFVNEALRIDTTKE